MTRGVRLPANCSVRGDIVLEPGTVTQTIEVQASAPVVNSESATIGNILLRAYRSTTSPSLLFLGPRTSFFIQDDWQVTPRLTVNVGLRYMYQTPWYERNNTISNFDFNAGRLVIQSDRMPSQAQERLVRAYPIVLAGEAGLPVRDIQPDRNNFGPRLGVAWRPFGGTRTVFRGGLGVYYNFLPVFIGFRQRGFNNPPFLLAESFEADASFRPSITLAAPFPGGGAISPNPSLTAVQKNIRNSESYQWNLTVERELRANLGFRVSYVGNHSTHLPWYNYSINLSREPIPGAIQPYRPYQPWSDILVPAGGGNSILHQLQVEAIQRYSSGLSFQLEYSWNRSLDDVPVVGGPQNPYNAPAERLKLQFRAEFFNAPNHFNWGGPAANISVPASVGRITSGGEARVIQFGLKLLF